MQTSSKANKPDPKTPFFCARYKEFDLWFEGIGWELPRTNAMMAGLENTRYADICGDDIGAMDGVGWEFLADPVCFTATTGDGRVVASAWAAPMQTEEKEVGCNLTYAVDAQYQGRSLAKLLSCLAFLACEQSHGGMTFANIECRSENHASIALAGSLAFQPYAEGDFTMPVAGRPDEVPFICLRADMDALRRRAFEALQEKKLTELLLLIQAAHPV
ncbi:MAG: family N-acetyltransferase [Burkholderia sp.]|nr:family N-acetyltransferase [Burkholderia sp.]